MITLGSFKEDLGDELDAAMIGVGFSVPRAEYTDIGNVYEVDDLPRIIYTWSLAPEMEMVTDIVSEQDFDTDPAKPTQTSKERIPHKMEISIRVASDVLWEADAMRDALLSGLGRAPCVGELPLYYEGFSGAGNEFKTGIYQYLFTYNAHIFLDGRSVTDLLILTLNEEISVAGNIEEAPETDDGPVVPDGAVTISEVVCGSLTRP